MKSNEKQQRRELLQEQLLKYQHFDIDGKLQNVGISWSASVCWGGQIEVDHLDITKEDVKRGLTEQQCNSLWDLYTEENLQEIGFEQCGRQDWMLGLEFFDGSDGIEVSCVLLEDVGSSS